MKVYIDLWQRFVFGIASVTVPVQVGKTTGEERVMLSEFSLQEKERNNEF